MPEWLEGWAEVDPATGCWLWVRALTTAGYGAWFRDGGRLAHRIVYQRLVGPIPRGLTIDHLCRTRRCVNPDHLEPVSMRVNLLRGESPAALNARKARCIHGHLFDRANTYWYCDYRGRWMRQCRRCRADYQQELRARRKAAMA
jgi:hypothetical protein